SSDKASNSDDSNSSSSSKSKCKHSSSGGSWGDDGTGLVNYKNLNAWKAEDLPDDLKKYAIDPKSVGLA
ncbi:CHAP domain-containing protein, partial [Streptococcus suis]